MIYYKRGDRKALIMNGDKIMAFIMMWIVEKLELVGIMGSISHCLVHTAYMNGNCLKFLKSNSVQTACVATGAKNFAKELQKYDLGAACDFSGHSQFHVNWKKINQALEAVNKTEHTAKLKKILELAEYGSGDAIATMLLAEAIMLDKDYTAMMFYKLYVDLPSKIKNVTVTYPKRFLCNEDESELLEPKRLQDVVHVFTKLKNNGARAFLRPAGTEHVLRLYVEAKIESEVDHITSEIVDEIGLKWTNYGEEHECK